MSDFHIGIVSHGRAKNVPKMETLLVGLPVTWYVKDAVDVNDYLAEGALDVRIGGTLCQSRNKVLEDAFSEGKIAVEISDDLKRLSQLLMVGAKKTAEIKDIGLVLPEMIKEFKTVPFKLAGVAPTPNPFYFHTLRSTNLFIIGDFLMVKPTNLRFDENLKLKEDYEYTVQHIKEYGGVYRFNDVFVTFSHYTNAGGVVEYRNEQKEKEAIDYLMKKHPGAFRLNPKRKNEILMNK
jgi:hypothetical protein